MEAVIFDLDGTIGNTLPLCIEAFKNTIEPLSNKSFSDAEIIATFGPSEEGTIKSLIPDHYDEGIEKYLQLYEELHFKWPKPFEGIVDVMLLLKQINVYVGMVTGKGWKSTKITLEAYGLENMFSCIKTGSIHGPVKKDRIEEVISETRISRTKILYVGDSPGDITASKECGVKSAAAAWAPTSDHDLLLAMNPDFIFGSIREFREFAMTIKS